MYALDKSRCHHRDEIKTHIRVFPQKSNKLLTRELGEDTLTCRRDREIGRSSGQGFGEAQNPSWTNRPDHLPFFLGTWGKNFCCPGVQYIDPINNGPYR